MMTLSTWPAAVPFWLIDEVAEGDAKLVRIGLAPASGTTSQVMAFGVAPLAQVAGPGIVMSAAGAVSTPAPLNVRLPVVSVTGAPTVPVTSTCGTVTV